MILFIIISLAMPSLIDRSNYIFLPLLLPLTGIFILCFLFLFNNYYKNIKLNNYILYDTETFLIFIILFYFIFFFKTLFFDIKLILFFGDFIYITPLVAALWHFSIIIRNKFKNNINKILTSLIPLVFLPFYYTFSAEFQYFLSKFVIMPTKFIYLFFCAITIFFIFYFKRIKPKSAGFLAKYYYFPSLIVVLLLSLVWNANKTLYLSDDYLHPGNYIVPIQ
ncbi:MAG: hypothetical protein LBF23_02575, partial [Endomicrobium sp.]|nr:hypothetical protein [Endomicrobium sp.]